MFYIMYDFQGAFGSILNLRKKKLKLKIAAIKKISWII